MGDRGTVILASPVTVYPPEPPMPDHPTFTKVPDAEPAHTHSAVDPATTVGGESSSTSASPLLASSGRYVLGEEIAHGGMGVVYRATDIVLGREVAVKVLMEKFGSASGAARRFADEAHITAQLQHPAIPPVHDLGVLPGCRPFLAMKLIKGETLEDQLAARPNPSHGRGRFIAVFEQICQALAYAHDRHVIHRDLKPANVMVGSFGEVQVMDWGLAKVLGKRPAGTAVDPDETHGGTEIRSTRESDGSETEAGSVLGTPAFMPPEQAVGAIGKIDARSDVFGLGAILAVILTGRPPFFSSSAETTRIKAAQGKVDECFAKLDACGADPELSALAKQCLSPDPMNRPKDASEVAISVAELRAAADDRARRAELDRAKAEGEKAAVELKVAEQRKRRRVQLLLAGAVGVLFFGLGAFAWWADRQETNRKNERDRVETQRAQELAIAEAERESRRIRISGTVANALSETRTRVEEAWGQADDPERMRTAADVALATLHRAEGFTDDRELIAEVLSDLLAVRKAVDDLNRHARLFLAADRALQDHAQSSFGPSANQRTARRLSDAFREFGWAAGQLSPEEVADVVVASRVRNQLLGFLGEWVWHDPEEQWMPTVLRMSRHKAGGSLDTWQSIRDRKDKTGLLAFAASPEALELGPEQICQLGHDLDAAKASGARLVLLRRCVERYPKHVWSRYDLMETCNAHSPPLHAEALQNAAAVAAIRPDSTLFQCILGDSLAFNGAFEPAEVAYRRAIKLDPMNAPAHTNLGNVLIDMGNIVGAESEYREAIKLDPFNPKTAIAHYNLGRNLIKRNEHTGAENELRTALKLDPKLAQSHVLLAALLLNKGDRRGAEETLQMAIKCDPNLADAHTGLGAIMAMRGDLTGAETEYRIAIQLESKNVFACVSLAGVLERIGDYDGAIGWYRKVLILEPKNPLASRNLPRAEQKKELITRLPDIIAGKAIPKNPAEEFAFAQLCGESYVRQYAAAVRLYERAFAADPKLADNNLTGRRYNPACYAARAVRGDGKDAPTDPAARAVLRAKAFAWLKTDLDYYKSQAKSSSQLERNSAARMLSQSLIDPDLSGMRPGLLRIGMPAEERAEWDSFWTDVRAALAEAQKPAPPPQTAR
jgi:eukaryotic-like serine/threonine-protein kinase